VSALRLQGGCVYGPVASRRLGASLGVNLLPWRCKVCSFDCIYCHYGETQHCTMSRDDWDAPLVADVLAAVRDGLLRVGPLDYITFSGNGEPTLHPQFLEIVAGVRRLRDELRSRARIALLSNSTTLAWPAVRAALELIDAPIMKLDAGDALTLAQINRPAPAVRLEDIVGGLRTCPRVTIQSVLVEGPATNVHGRALQAWIDAVGAIRPERVQIYSTDRPVADSSVRIVTPEALEHLASELEQRLAIPVTAYWS
jgi:wyosine [tRNA(Phe)-imidazoG37] synthetase (radical SAM superfamily)